MAPLLRRQCEQGQQRQQGGWGRAAAQAAAAAGVLGLGLGAAALMEEGDQLEVGRWGRVWGRSMHCSIRMDATDTANQSARCANQTHAVIIPNRSMVPYRVCISSWRLRHLMLVVIRRC